MSEFECRTQEDFFRLLNFYRVATYQQKISFMKEYWGNILVKTTIPYGDKCSITIGIGDDNKYYFDFDCKNLALEDLDANLREYALDILSLSKDELLKKYPEIRNIDKEEKLNVIDNEPKDVFGMQSIDYNYLNVYNGIYIDNK